MYNSAFVLQYFNTHTYPQFPSLHHKKLFDPAVMKSAKVHLKLHTHTHTHTHNGRFFSIATIMLLLILCPVNNKSNNCKFLFLHKVASSLLYKIRFLKTNMWLWKIIANRRTIILKIRRQNSLWKNDLLETIKQNLKNRHALWNKRRKLASWNGDNCNLFMNT